MRKAFENGRVFVVEDDAILREATIQALELSGLSVEGFDSAVRASRNLTPGFEGCVVTDIRMDEMDGMQLFARVRALDPEIPVILITGHGDIEMAVRAMRDGAFDFLAKPFGTDHLTAVVRKALQSRRLVLDNRALRDAIAKSSQEPVAQSRIAGRLRANIAQVAQTNFDVRIVGESGAGKEYWATQIHRQSRRHARPFIVRTAERFLTDGDLNEVAQDCAGGTLFLEECEALSAEQQFRLSSLLDKRERQYTDTKKEADFRIIVATRDDSASGVLQEALSHRIGAISLRVPPLRERREDIPILFAGFVRDALEQTGKKRFEMTATDRKRLIEYDWPGNIRELRNYAFGAVLNLPRRSLSEKGAADRATLTDRVLKYEKMLIVEALEAANGNVMQTSALLRTPRKTLYEKFARHGIDPSRFRAK